MTAVLRRALAEARRLREEWAAVEARVAGLKREAAEAKARAAQARDSALDAEAEKMLGGKPTAGRQPNPDELRKRGRVAERAAAKVAATLPGIAEQRNVAEAALVNALLADMLAAAERARAEALEIAARLGSPLADMMAGEKMRNTILGGERFTFDRDAIDPGRLFSAAIVVRKFLEALADDLTARFPENPEEMAFVEEHAAWCRSDGQEQGTWRRVRKFLKDRSE